MKYHLSMFTLDEKLNLLSGKNMWQLDNANGKLPTVFLTDGPNGLRKQDPETEITSKATSMPSISLLSCSWDRQLAFLDGNTIGDDCLENDVDILLAPGVNIKRTPLCGRNFEYFSEDPYLAGELGKFFIEGVQDKGIGTSLKHFACNNREYERLFQSNEVDERTLYEIYLAPFERALQAKPWMVMCSYNLINGVWSAENKWLLNDVLRKQFGFDGVIVSDWEAVRNSVRSVKATLDIKMPYNKHTFSVLKSAVEKGELTEEEIDERITKILELVEKTVTKKGKVTTTKEERHKNAVKIASEGMVLLKNQDNILPLKNKKILISGLLDQFKGGGCAFVESDYQVKSLKEELEKRLDKESQVTESKTYITDTMVTLNSKSTYKLAYTNDVVILSVGTGKNIEGEGFDRVSLKLSPVQEDLIINTAKVNNNVIVLVNSGSAIDMSSWIDKVKGVIFTGFSGEGGNEAIADILTGKVNPSGKLSETFPINLENSVVGESRGNGFVERYTEGVFTGYRYYDTFNKEVLFPFGYGLSYSQFEYSDLTIDKVTETDYEVSFNVKNISDIDGKEISELYVKDVFSSVSRPEKELKGFVKTLIKAGETKRINISLDRRSFAFYSQPLHNWYVENGIFEILIGTSSKDIKLKGKIEIKLPESEQYTF